MPLKFIPCRSLFGFVALLCLPLASLNATGFFMTHHSPVGAWSSLTFGLPGDGVGVDTEGLAIQPSGDLLVACSRGPGKTTVLPFFTRDGMDDYEGSVAGA